ncbi:MAG: energy-coupling factor transporter ATPase [Clostridia bacterium]|nr:energy-coupling factor transporter ATPase [Clostridia bacterium]MDY5263729.1 energy-coupling factor transporter ATPase [Eubacteriales bacterium]MDY5439161.1 energy-coupling factor transporter ATPase [Eubacteriales bacterium]
MTAISIKNVKYVYNPKTEDELEALKGVSLDIEEGEFVALVGHNGSGKSTLAKMLNGLMLPSEGTVEVYGNLTTDDDKVFDIRKSVGIVFQNPDNQMIASIVEDDVAFGPENIGVPREEIIKRVDWALSVVDMLEYRTATPFKMSGGQKQRIAIAGVLALLPKILVLDESTAMLDPKGRKEVMDTILKLNKKENITVVHITHHMEEVVCADKVVVMNDGFIEKVGTPKEIFSDIDLLNRCKLELPLARQIANKLSSEGLNLGDDILTEEELEEKLCQLL